MIKHPNPAKRLNSWSILRQASARSRRISPSCRSYRLRARTRSTRRMRPRRWLVLSISITEATDPTYRVQTLLKCCEAAICPAAAHVASIIGAPRIILSFGACPYCNGSDVNSQQEQQNPHSHLHRSRLSATNPALRVLFAAKKLETPAMRRGALRPGWRSLKSAI
jgi:hypothetical protein